MSQLLWQKPGVQVDARIQQFLAGEDVILDREFFLFDVQASRAHAQGLQRIDILDADELAGLERELDVLAEDFRSGRFVLDEQYEDGHSAIEVHHSSLLPPNVVGLMTTQLSHLKALESESIHIFREVAAEFEKPVLLFSGGKDSAVMLRLAEKAFWPARIPFPVMHVDTGHNFEEALDFRDRRCAELGVQLVVASVQASIDTGRVVEETGPKASRNRLQTITLLDAIAEHGFDAVFGGGRRDEEKARAKERVYSFRDDFGQWDPKNQRPELWNLYNGRHRKGEHIRVFPLSNWTELDVWQYVADDGVELPSIYYAHRREVFRRDGMLLAVTPYVTVMEGEEPEEMMVRFRTVGDASCTGAVESSAATVEEVIAEVAASRVTERGETRADDRISEAGMEDRKREGYF